MAGRTFATRWGRTEIISAEHFSETFADGETLGGVMFAGITGDGLWSVAALPYGDSIREI